MSASVESHKDEANVKPPGLFCSGLEIRSNIPINTMIFHQCNSSCGSTTLAELYIQVASARAEP